MRVLRRTEDALWLCLLLFVPVSASPLLPLGSGTLVRPLAIVPASLLLLLALFRMMVLGQRPDLGRDGGGLPLLLVFAAYATLSGLARVAFLPEDSFKGQTPLESLVRALLTLGIGMAFYFVARLRIRTAEDIRRTLRVLFIGMTASVALAVLQVAAMVRGGSLLRIVQSITDLFAVHYDGLFSRAQGMTFEPSWLAMQIIVLVVPALVARGVSRQAFVAAGPGRMHLLRLAGGFGVALVGLLCAGSRFGLASIAAMLLLSGWMVLRSGRLMGMLAIVLMLALGGGGLVAMRGLNAGAGANYVTGPLTFLAGTGAASLDAADATPAEKLSDVLAMAGRAAAWQSAAGMWLDHPLFGVSLGNSYRYFGTYAPDWAFTTQLFQQGAKEGVGWLDPNSPEKGNAKSLVLRLLSETGIVGFLLFALFFVRQVFRTPARDAFHVGFRLATATALAFSFINQDSLADPVIWIPIALCAAMGRLSEQPVE